jgi:transcriptional repressor NrdR
MRCPFCGHEESQVKDSRPSDDGASIRRRRSCPSCGGRFTTHERIQLREIMVAKSDGTVQPFDRDKIHRSMRVALRKRPVTPEQIEKAVTGIVRQVESSGESETTTKAIGQIVMNALVELDIVGYIRYASVYKDFREPEEFSKFVAEIQSLQNEKNKQAE